STWRMIAQNALLPSHTSFDAAPRTAQVISMKHNSVQTVSIAYHSTRLMLIASTRRIGNGWQISKRNGAMSVRTQKRTVIAGGVESPGQHLVNQAEQTT